MESKPPDHPVAHVKLEKRYEWLRAECAALDAARQAREDGLIGTITQISSAALLIIPGLLLSSDSGFPDPEEAPLLFAGILFFLAALALALLEQYLSAPGYRRHRKIVENYYLLQSDKTEDTNFDRWVRLTRNFACLAFAAAVLASAVGLIIVNRAPNGKSASTSASATSPTTAAAATSAATSATTSASASASASATSAATAAAAGTDLRGRLRQEIESRTNYSAAAKTR